MKRRDLLTLFLSLLCYVNGVSQDLDSLEVELNSTIFVDDKLNLIQKIVNGYGAKSEAELYVKTALMISKNQTDSVQLKGLGIAAKYYENIDTEKAKNYYHDQLEIDAISESQAYSANAYFYLGKIYRKQYKLDSSQLCYELALGIYKNIGSPKSISSCYNKLGVLQKDLGNFKEALEYYYLSLGIAEYNQLKSNLASTYINIGVVLKKQGEYQKALGYYDKAEEIYLEKDSKIGLANVYNNKGNVERLKDNYDAALLYYHHAVKNRKESNSESMISYSYNNIALIHRERKQYDSALFYLNLSQSYKEKLGEIDLMASTYLNKAEIYKDLDDSLNYLTYFKLCENNAINYNDVDVLQDLYLTYSEWHEQRGNYKDAHEYLLKVISQLDTLDEDKKILQSKVLHAKFENSEKKKIIEELEKEKKKTDSQNQEIENSRANLKLLSYALIFALIVSGVILVFLIRNFRRIKEQSQELNQSYLEISESKISIEEKTVLIKEIHHRVKNNLQIIKSLIRLQNSKISKPEVEVAFKDFENRVASMALVHESLYKSESLSKVNVKTYYNKLLEELVVAYNVGVNLTTKFNVNVSDFGIDTLVPLGLLTNEIISNTFKHGFIGRTEGVLTVSLKGDGESYKLIISDDGNGIDTVKSSEDSLGMELIETLVGQLDGDLKIDSGVGTTFYINFKNQDKKL